MQDVAKAVDDPVRVILTLRDDFLLRAEAVPALRARLAQPEQEHSEQWWRHEVSNAWAEGYEKGRLQREWQGLTDEDVDEVERWIEFKEEGSGRIPNQKLVRYIEAKLKAKNS